MDWLEDEAERERWQEWVAREITKQAGELGVVLELTPEAVCIVGAVEASEYEPLARSNSQPEDQPIRRATFKLLERERKRQQDRAKEDARSKEASDNLKRRFKKQNHS